jgi:anti-sigma factor (TIGR02949 family)
MNCQENQDQLSAYLDGELTADETAAVRDHLAACPACARELDELRRAIDAVKALPPIQAPADLKGKIMAQIESEAARAPASTPWRKLWPVAAAVALAVGLTIFSNDPTAPDPLDNSRIVAYEPETGAKDAAFESVDSAPRLRTAEANAKAPAADADDKAFGENEGRALKTEMDTGRATAREEMKQARKDAERIIADAKGVRQSAPGHEGMAPTRSVKGMAPGGSDKADTVVASRRKVTDEFKRMGYLKAKVAEQQAATTWIVYADDSHKAFEHVQKLAMSNGWLQAEPRDDEAAEKLAKKYADADMKLKTQTSQPLELSLTLSPDQIVALQKALAEKKLAILSPSTKQWLALQQDQIGAREKTTAGKKRGIQSPAALAENVRARKEARETPAKPSATISKDLTPRQINLRFLPKPAQ